MDAFALHKYVCKEHKPKMATKIAFERSLLPFTCISPSLSNSFTVLSNFSCFTKCSWRTSMSHLNEGKNSSEWHKQNDCASTTKWTILKRRAARIRTANQNKETAFKPNATPANKHKMAREPWTRRNKSIIVFVKWQIIFLLLLLLVLACNDDGMIVVIIQCKNDECTQHCTAHQMHAKQICFFCVCFCLYHNKSAKFQLMLLFFTCMPFRSPYEWIPSFELAFEFTILASASIPEHQQARIWM